MPIQTQPLYRSTCLCTPLKTQRPTVAACAGGRTPQWVLNLSPCLSLKLTEEAMSSSGFLVFSLQETYLMKHMSKHTMVQHMISHHSPQHRTESPTIPIRISLIWAPPTHHRCSLWYLHTSDGLWWILLTRSENVPDCTRLVRRCSFNGRPPFISCWPDSIIEDIQRWFLSTFRLRNDGPKNVFFCMCLHRRN